MRRHALRLSAGIAAAPLALTLLVNPAAMADPPELTGPGLAGVVPTVKELTLSDGEPFTLTPTTRIVVSAADEDDLRDEARLLASELVALDRERALGMDHAPQVVVGDDPGESGDIVLQVGAVADVSSDEGYELVVDGAVTITAPTDTGVFYGTRTLLQSLASSGGAQAATVLDEPAKPERSLHVDAARKYYSPGWFADVIRDMASIKLNQLQYHFSENEGFRLESTEHPEILSEEYLTQEELADVLALAAQYHIEVVPALDLPGHLNKALEAHPEFRASDTDEGRKVLDYSNPDARSFLFDLIDEFADLFPGSRWHMGGDEIFNVEAPSDPATRFPQLQAYAEAEVGPDASIHDGYIHFLNEVNEHLHSLGKTHVRVWNDALYGDDTSVALDPSIDVTYWTKWHPSMPTVETIREHGHNVVNFNDSFFYYVLANPGGAYATPRPASDIYDDWRPGVFPDKDWTAPADQKAQVYPEPSPDWIGGASYAIWSDIPERQTEDEVAAGIRLPLRAMAERVWNPTGSTADYEEWLARVEAVGTLPAPVDLDALPDLTLTKTATSTREGSVVDTDLQVGDELTWQVQVTNEGDTSARFTIADDLSDVLDEVTLSGEPVAVLTDDEGAVVPEPGANVALGRPVTASGQEVAGQWGPELAVDGITGGQAGPEASRWSSNEADDAWLAVELAEPTTIDHVTIYWEEACAALYRIDVSDDGIEWTPATEDISPVCGSVDRLPLLTDEPVSFIRMQGLDRTPIEGTKYGMSLWELQAWTGAETGVVTPEPSLTDELLTWQGGLEPGQTVTVTYAGVVSAEGNGEIVNTATVTAPYFPDLDLQASTRHHMKTTDPTPAPSDESDDDSSADPTGDSSTDPTGDSAADHDDDSASSTAGTADAQSPGSSAAGQDGGSGADDPAGALPSTGSAIPGALIAVAVLLLVGGAVLHHRRTATSGHLR